MFNCECFETLIQKKPEMLHVFQLCLSRAIDTSDSIVDSKQVTSLRHQNSNFWKILKEFQEQNDLSNRRLVSPLRGQQDGMEYFYARFGYLPNCHH